MTALPPHPNGTTADGSAPPPPPRAPRPRRRRLVRSAIAVLVVAWAFAIWYSVNRTNPENLTDAERTAVADACDAARAELAALPRPPGPAELHERVAAENQVFDDFVDALRAVEPADGTPAEAFAKWIDDWAALGEWREDVADTLAAEGSAELRYLTDDDSRPLPIRMDEYARQQRLEGCRPDALDVEVLDGTGNYEIPEG